jgi:hypothetical protein
MNQLIIFLLLTSFSLNTFAIGGVYQSNQDFLNEVFEKHTPKPKILWLTKKIKPSVTKILGNKPKQLRVRYWGNENKTAWILEEIGKEKLITFGIVVIKNKIQLFKVLSFRESRGWEIVQPFFSDQYSNIALKEDLSLNKKIDGISGATLSVRASKKMAQLALFFHKHSKFGQ